MEVKVIIGCIFCQDKHESTIIVPDGWQMRYDEIYEEERGFCPKHAAVAEFADNQCPGCVASWGSDCPLWRSFAYKGRRDITEQDFSTIRAGKCPRRVNGSFGFSPQTGFIDLNLSEPAPDAAGAALEAAIREYIAEYK